MNNIRVAWLLPVAWFYWHPVLSHFSQIFPETKIFTGLFPGFARGFENTFTVEEVGKMNFLETNQTSTGYGTGFTYLSPKIISKLLQFKPNVIIADSFRIWTILALLLKPLLKWRVILAYEGSSPSVDYRHSRLRTIVRRIMVKAADACITNSKAGKDYLTDFLLAEESRVFCKPYEVPDSRSLLGQSYSTKSEDSQPQKPVFLFVGHLVKRKGVDLLLKSCSLLQKEGKSNYTLLIAGDGPQKEELEAFCQENNLTNSVKFLGKLNYEQLGAYFHQADVFVLPTLEDTWGMVVLEAMLFGKPVLCSQWAGSSEMIVDGKNGYVFDPNEPEKLAERLNWFMNNLNQIHEMGEKSKNIMVQYTPETAAKSLAKVVEIAQVL